MLKNDENCWVIDKDHDPVTQSWGAADGQFDKLWQHSVKRWGIISKRLPCLPSGRVVEFGAGMGLMDDLLGEQVTELVLLDHTIEYIRQRPRPLSSRARIELWSPQTLIGLQSASFDWWIAMAVFYHIDEATAIALLLESAKIIKPGGRLLIYGWIPPERYPLQDTFGRLFQKYPTYTIDMNLVSEMARPWLIEEFRCQDWPTILFRKV